MSATPFIRIAALAAALALPAAALAHHGWSWTQDGFFRLEGRIAAMTFGNPHPTLDVDADGTIWRVDLATPSATQRAGFTEASAKVGDEVTVIGNRSRDETEMTMKAVRLTVNGKTFDVYPSRVPPS